MNFAGAGRLVLTSPPYPEIGDALTDSDDDSGWIVLGIEDTEVLIGGGFSEGRKG